MSSETGTCADFLHAKTGVGSIKVRPTYAAHEQAFHRTDVPERARERRVEVKRYKRSKVLSAARPSWDTTTTPAGPHVSRAASKISEFDRSEFKYNFRAEVLPAPRPVTRDVFGRAKALTMKNTKRMEEMPVHPSLEGKPRWEISTQLADTEREAALRAGDVAHLRHSARVSRSLTGYVRPDERQALRMEELRRERTAVAEERRRLEEQRAGIYRFSMREPVVLDERPGSRRPPSLSMATFASDAESEGGVHGGGGWTAPVPSSRLMSAAIAALGRSGGAAAGSASAGGDGRGMARDDSASTFYSRP